MAAYAALVSLLQILDTILQPGGPPFPHHPISLEYLREKVSFLLTFLQDSSAYTKRNENESQVKILERKITEVSCKAEDVIQSHISSRLFSTESGSRIFVLGSKICGIRIRISARFMFFYPQHILYWQILLAIFFDLTTIIIILPFISAGLSCWIHMAVERKLPLAFRRLFYLYVPKYIVFSGASFWPYDSQLGVEEFRQVMDDMSSTVRDVIEIKDMLSAGQDKEKVLLFASSSRGRTGKEVVVGLDSDLIKIKTLLVSDSSGIRIVPIVGMGGIGKTTLAREVYDDSYIVYRFDIRAWVTVSQEHSLRQVLLGLLDSAKMLTESLSKKSETLLSEHLFKTLKGRRYLIVMDDMWDTEIWDAMRRSFPEDDNGSRVILTTRLSNVAQYPNSCSPLHEMCFLSKHDSWKLLCSKVFGEEGCPVELEGVGNKILRICGGIPLSIVVIGGVLSKLNRTAESWTRVADNLSSIFSEDDEQCMQILLLSYNHLPHHLRACFLYMGVFLENYDIPVEKVIQLWGAEGFLRLSGGESLEEVAEVYLDELVERNLILVSKRNSGGKIKTCNIHDLLRNLCVQIANKENFFQVMKCDYDVTQEDGNTRRLSIHPDHLNFHAWYIGINGKYNSSARTVLCTGAGFARASSVYLGYRLLRVLDLLLVVLFTFPDQVIKLVHLIYLALTCDKAIPSSIFILWNLKTLVYRNWSYRPCLGLPVEIWMLPKLRHLCVSPAYLPSFSLEILGRNFSLQDLQSLSNIRNFKCHPHILERIPNLKQLKISYDDSPSSTWSEYQFEALVHLHELEILKLLMKNPDGASVVVYPPKRAFPQKLKELTLSGCGIPWDDLMIAGALENLQVLKLRGNACRGTEWRPVEGQFCKLKYLLLEELDIMIWEADENHFPLLQHLAIRSCHNLNEIPSGIGEIPTLQMIELADCNPSAVESAEKLIEEQESMGNEDLKLYVGSKQRSTKKFFSRFRTARFFMHEMKAFRDDCVELPPRELD